MRSSAFVGRREQLAALEDAVRRADAGEPQLVVVSGDAGIGKTRLLGQLADRIAGSGAWVLRTACVELGSHGLPLAPVTAALRQLADQVPAETMAAAGSGADALWRLLPESGGSSPDLDSPARLFDLFGMLLHRLGAAHPVLWLVDDMHWADRSTRELLGFLARTLGGCRVAVVLAYRADDLARGHPLSAFLAELGHQPGVRRIGLGGFSRAEVAELLAGTFPGEAGDDLVDRVYRQSGGNPLYALELAQAGVGDDQPGGLPDSLRDLLVRRVEQLPETPRQVVRWAAAGGRYVPHGLLAAAISMPEPDLDRALRAAADLRVLLPDRAGYAFRHDLVREAVAGDFLPAERRRLHRRFAEALGTDPGLVPADRYAAEVAYHWYEAGDAARALPALLRAAEAAANVAAHAEQAQVLDRALRLWPEVPASQRPAGADQAGLFESAITAATWAGDYHHALQLADRAQPAAERAAGPHQASMLHAQRALLLCNLRRDGALAAAEESWRRLPPGASTGRAKVLELLGPVLVMLGRIEHARRVAEEAARFAATTGDAGLELSARSTLGWALTEAGAYPAAIETLQAALLLAEGRPAGWQLVRVYLNLSKALHEAGQYQAAIAAAQDGADTARTAGMERTLGAYTYVQLATSLTAAGRWDEAETTIGQALNLDPPGSCAAALHALRAEIALARGDRGTANGELSLADAAAGSPAQVTPWTLAVSRLRAELAMADGRTDDARRIAAAALRAARQWAAPAQLWALLVTGARIETFARLQGRALPGSGDGMPATQELREIMAGLPADTPECAAHAAEFAAETGQAPGSWPSVADAWDAVGNPYRAAHARMRAAAAARPQQAAVRNWLREAAGQAARLGAQPLLDEIRLLARTSHVQLDSDAGPADQPDVLQRLGLSSREMEVLRLIAAGRSNRQIGEHLFISTKTASVHVSSILAKLGAASRGEAAATAHRLGLFGPEAPAGRAGSSPRPQDPRADLR